MAHGILIRFLLACCAGALAAAPTQACRVYRAASERIATLYSHQLFAGALLVRITDAHYTRAALPDRDGHPWQANATVERVLSGNPRAAVIQFYRGGGSAACDDGTPVPRPGDQWVLYLSSHQGGRVAVNLSYPLAAALREDPNLAGLLNPVR